MCRLLHKLINISCTWRVKHLGDDLCCELTYTYTKRNCVCEFWDFRNGITEGSGRLGYNATCPERVAFIFKGSWVLSP
jgi:hypothetical protein